jgi:phosphate/sulfate permease
MSRGSGLIHAATKLPYGLVGWVSTLPASMILAGFLFWGFRNIF